MHRMVRRCLDYENSIRKSAGDRLRPGRHRRAEAQGNGAVLRHTRRHAGDGGGQWASGKRHRLFAVHIHEGSDCGGTDFSDTGGHYNPDAREHPRHAGDLPPLLSMGGRAFLAVETGRFTPCDVVGRTVVIHGSTDDFHTQPAGNAGKKIACGVIRQV